MLTISGLNASCRRVLYIFVVPVRVGFEEVLPDKSDTLFNLRVLSTDTRLMLNCLLGS